MEWKTDNGQYVIGSTLHLGKWAVGGSHYDACIDRNDPKKYRATCRLPGIKSELGHFVTDAEAREVVERAVKHWISGLPGQHESKDAHVTG